jgi:3-deoxy-D-manno-octulosonate 8-phosphate phosphatase (KDO 8-P phosphatase)
MKPPRSRPFRSGPRPFRGPRAYESGDAGPEDAPRRPYRPAGGPAGGGWEGRRERTYQDRGYGRRSFADRPAPYRERYDRPQREFDRPRRPAEAPEPAPRPAAPDPRHEERLRKVKLFLCDVDGILTDAGVYMGEGEETKRFNIRDGFGLRLLQRQGIKVGWISHRPSVATTKRAEDLKIDFLHQEPGSKVAVIEAILTQNGFTWEETCFMGDDIVDLGALKRAGFAATVSNGLPEVKALAHYVAKASAGYGAVREVAEMILKAQDKWAPLVAEYSA